MAGLLFLALCLMLCAPASAEDLFLVTAPPEGISGYQNNPLTVTVPEEGTVSLEIRDEDNTLYRVLEKEVPAGRSEEHTSELQSRI